MVHRLIVDENGLFSCEFEVQGRVLEDALARGDAEDVIKCAVIVALSALAQEGAWPGTLLEVMSAFMSDLRDEVLQETLS
jgi:hypothetical protein